MKLDLKKDLDLALLVVLFGFAFGYALTPVATVCL